MGDLWIVKGNVPESWNFDELTLERGERQTNDWSRTISRENWLSSVSIPVTDNLTNNDQSGNNISFLNAVLKGLDYKEGNLINTINIYEHANYTIQAMYITDHDFQNSDEFNYFATVVNIESIHIFGPAVFFKTSNNTVSHLTSNELLNCFANFYYVQGIKLSYGKFTNIGVNNYEPDIENMFKGYKVRRIDNWLIFSDDKDSGLDDLKESDNDLSLFNNIVWLKLKNYSGEVNESMSDIEHNKGADYRGLYMDVDESYIRNVFF